MVVLVNEKLKTLRTTLESAFKITFVLFSGLAPEVLEGPAPFNNNSIQV